MSADSHVGNAGSILLTLWFDLRGSKSEVPIASLWEEPGYLSSNRPRIESLRGLIGNIGSMAPSLRRRLGPDPSVQARLVTSPR